MELWDYITCPENMWNAYNKTQVGKFKLKAAAIRFYMYEQRKLQDLLESIIDGSYIPSPYKKFVIHEPKDRLIYAPCYQDKIVQHLLNNILAPYFQRFFIDDSFACITDRGNRLAVKRLQQQFKVGYKQYGDEAYIVKIDIAKFFYRINRVVLKTILKKFISCWRTLKLLFLIIDRSPGHIGIPLGNLTSQLFANVYLNILDRHYMYVYSKHGYLRYADDIFIVVRDKETAQIVLRELSHFIDVELKLTAHTKKSHIRPLITGIDGLGFYVYPTHIRLNSRFKRKVRKYVRRIPTELSDEQLKEVNNKLAAWYNVMTIARHLSFIYQLLEQFHRLQFDHQKARLYITS